MGEIVEQIRVVGAGQAKADLEGLAGAQEGIGKAADDASGKTQKAGQELDLMGGASDRVGASIKNMLSAFAPITLITAAFREMSQVLERIVKLQSELSGSAVSLAGGSKKLARQLGVDETRGAEILTELRTAGGLDAATAQSFGIAADVAFSGQGGLLGNMDTAKELAGFVGTNALTPADADALLGFLRTAGKLDSPESAKTATAQIAAAGRASKAPSIGAFSGLIARGGTGLLQAGVPMEDVLSLAGQARQVEVNEELAAQSLLTLEQVATGAEKGFTKRIDARAKGQGLDPAALTTVQRVGLTREILGEVDTQAEENAIRKEMSPERSGRLLKAFRGSNVAATQGIGEAAAGATAADFDVAVDQGRGELTFRSEAAKAENEYDDYLTGQQVFNVSKLRDDAKKRLDRKRALRQVSGLKETLFTDEGLEETEAVNILQEEMNKLRESGVDVSGIEDALAPYRNKVLGGYEVGPSGVNDQRLEIGARELDKAQRRSRGINVQVTNIGTQFAGDRIGEAPPPLDVDQ